MSSRHKASRVGIYAGTFDPVHAGHITFALEAIERGELDEVIFLPERKPRHKSGVEHFGHRVAMLNRAIRPHRKLSVLELVDTNFTVQKTLPRLKTLLPEARFSFLIGADVLTTLPYWPGAEKLLKHDLIVGRRADEPIGWLHQQLEMLPVRPPTVTIVDSIIPNVSSGRIRHALRHNQMVEGVLKSVHRYASQNWLYISVKDM